jgi:hypothetical protein
MAVRHMALAVTVLILLCGCKTSPPEDSPMTSTTEAGPEVRRKGGRVWIDGVKKYEYIDPMFEAVRMALALRGDEYSAAYMQGISGSAFRIGGICVCAPTCDNAMWPQQLVRLLGYKAQPAKVDGEGEQLQTTTREAVRLVRAEIDAGRAVLVWHAFTTAEWDVVYGYDAEKGTFLGRGSYKGNDAEFAEAKESRMATCGDMCPTFGAVLIGQKTHEFDARKAEFAALVEAVRHARDQRNVDGLSGDEWDMLSGIACYSRWAEAWKDPKRKRSDADAYCFGIYRDTHAAAGPFLREIAPKYGKGKANLLKAAEHFDAEAATLAKGEKLLWWDSPRQADAERSAAAHKLLTEACEHYAAGVAEIEAALEAESVRSEDLVGEHCLRRLDFALLPEGSWGGCLPVAIAHCVERAGGGAHVSDIMASNGWAFSFAYNYSNWHCAALHFGQFDWLPAQLGYEVRKAGFRDREKLWGFIREHVDAGTPIATTIGDGGLIYAYRVRDGQREIWFEGEPVGAGWLNLNSEHPANECAVFARAGKPAPREEIYRESLRRALAAAEDPGIEQTPRGLAALDAYLADVKDPDKSFENISEWFCWATFERLTARKQAAGWLRGRVAGAVGEEAKVHVLAAADQYDNAFEAYHAYDLEVHREDLGDLSWHEKFRTPERIAALAEPLETGIQAEKAAVEHLRKAAAILDGGNG